MKLNTKTLTELAYRLDVAKTTEEALRERRERQIDEMRLYARARSCRRANLLVHFGEAEVLCSGCDNCDVPLQGAA